MEWLSMNSDMSTRTSASSVSNRNSASALQSSVLPTPVGPRKRNEPLGRSTSESPARDRRTVSETARIASSWPITRDARADSMCSSRSRSPSTSRAIGIPVHFETTSATSSSVTELRSSFVATDVSPSASRFSSSGIRPYWISAIRARSPARRAVSSSRRARSSRSLAFCDPCSRAFSARHTSSRSAYSRSSPAMDSSIRPRRSPDAWSLSLARASRSILS